MHGLCNESRERPEAKESSMIEEPFEGKKLFTVEIERTIMVMASDRKEAEAIASEVESEFSFNSDNEATFSAYEPGKYLPNGWDTGIPYGLENMKDQTCEQIMGAFEEYERTRPPTKAELEALGQQQLISESEAA